MRKATLALLLVIGAAAHGQAQRARPEPIRFDHLSVEQGLSQSIVRAVLHDAAGFLWFATHDGLNQYDGYRLTIYRHEPDNPNSLPSSVVMSLAEQATPGGAVLWIGTNDGLAAFHAAQDRFTRYLPGEVVPALHVDRAGVVWAGTGRGIRRFDGSSFQPLPEQDVAGEPNVATDAINTFADAGGGALWVGTVRGLARIDARGATAWRGLEGEYIRAIVPDRRGRVWVATDASGILRLNLAAGRIDRFRAGDGGLTGNSVNALLEDTDGDLWAGVWGGGLVRIVEAANGDVTFLSYRHDAADPSSLGIDDLNALAQDRSGVVWVGTYGAGLSRFHPQARKRFAHFKRSTAADDLRDDRLFALLVDRSGVLWAGTWLGVDRFVRTGPGIGDYTRVPDPALALTDQRVTAIVEGRDGTVWIATLDGGINRVDPRTLRNAPLRREQGLSSDRVMSLAVSSDGAIWAGTLDAGLNRIQPGTGAVAVFRAGAAEDTLASDRVDAVIEDRHGTTWVGTYAGLHAIPPTRQGVIRTWKDPAVAGLLGGQITALHEAADGTLWVGTGGRGVVRVDIGAEGRPVTATPLRRREGLPNDNVFAIRSDAQGSVWFNTGDGLARFDPASGRIVAFGVADGVQGKEFREAAFFEPATGRLFVGGTNGFSVFEPAAVEAAAPPPPVMLTAFSVLNRPVPIGPGSPLPVRITDAATVTLRPGASVFSIEFAAADFTDPQRVRYAYQLEGFDAEWNETDASRRFATYTNLSPGRYTFRVRAANRDGEWNPEPRELAVIILPPFWMTWWFRTLAVMAIAALVLTVHRMRLRGVEAQRARLAREVIARTRELEEEKARALTAQTMAEQANDAKSAFLAGVSHELRTPLNAIVGLADVLGDSETGPRQQQYIAALRSSGQALSELIDDILDLSKIEAGRFELVATPFDVRALVEESVDLVRLAAEQKGLRVTVALAANVPAVVEGDARALRRILFNLLSNAVKFTAAGSVSVDVASRSDGTLLFIVADTGIGIAPEHQERIFATFTQAEPGIAQEYGGTGLGLALTRQLAHLMAGRIWVDSQVGVGTTFVVALPLPAASAAPAAAAQSRPGDGLRVLAVDDAAMNRLVLEAYFQGTPHTLVLADNGTAALAMFRESRFDVVLMDVNMPGMDGYATIREMRAWESAEHRPRTPIVAFTAHAFADDVERSRVAGCDGHLAKPLRREALMAALAHQAAGGAPAPTVQVDADLAGYLPDYLTATRAQLAAALADLDAGRRDPLRTLGHNLKGSGGSFGLPGISRLGMELEDAAVRGSESQLREGARRLGEYLAEVRVTFGGEHI